MSRATMRRHPLPERLEGQSALEASALLAAAGIPHNLEVTADGMRSLMNLARSDDVLALADICRKHGYTLSYSGAYGLNMGRASGKETE